MHESPLPGVNHAGVTNLADDKTELCVHPLFFPLRSARQSTCDTYPSLGFVAFVQTPSTGLRHPSSDHCVIGLNKIKIIWNNTLTTAQLGRATSKITYNYLVGVDWSVHFEQYDSRYMSDLDNEWKQKRQQWKQTFVFLLHKKGIKRKVLAAKRKTIIMKFKTCVPTAHDDVALLRQCCDAYVIYWLTL